MATGDVLPAEADALAKVQSQVEAGNARAALDALAELLKGTPSPGAIDAAADAARALHAKAPDEVEAILSWFTRAEERTGPRRALAAARADIHARAGHHAAAIASLSVQVALIDDAMRGEAGNAADLHQERARAFERMGDIALTGLQLPQQALIHYQHAAATPARSKPALRKAARIYLQQGKEAQAKHVLDEEAAHADGLPPESRAELADLYVTIAETLLVRPSAHDTARSALATATSLGGDAAKLKALKAEIDGFADRWKDHVRRLRDGALDARDKRDAARRYLSIAEIFAAYAPQDPQIEQNVEKCLLLAPGYRPALKFLESIARSEGKLPEFIERLKKRAESVRAVDTAVELWLYVAMLLAERGAPPADVAAAYDKVRRVDPRNVPAIHALTELHLAGGDYDKAVIVMEAFLAEADDIEAKKNTLRQLARLYEVELRDMHKATERLEQLAALDSDDDDVLAQLRDLHERTGNEAKLADILDLELRPTHRRDAARDAPLLERLMQVSLGSLAMPDRAFNAGRRLIVLSGRESLETELVRLGETLGRTGELAQAFVDAAVARTVPAETRRLKLKAAGYFLSAGDKKRARTIADELLTLDPKDRDAQTLLDGILLRDSSPEEHAAVLEQRLRGIEEPKERVDVLLALADVYARARRVDDAVFCCREVLEIDAGSRAAYDRLETIFRGQERFADLADALVRRLRLETDLGDADRIAATTLKLARIYDDKLNRGDDAAGLYLKLLDGEARVTGESEAEVLRALERLLAKGVSPVAIAEVLQPVYAQAHAWKKHAEMLSIRHGACEDPAGRAALARSLASVLEERLNSPLDAFDAWGDVLVDEAQQQQSGAARPGLTEAERELVRLVEPAHAHARLADVLLRAADAMAEGAPRDGLLASRAKLLDGVLGDQVSAIETHKKILEKNPQNLGALDALAELYTRRDAAAELKDVLSRRAAASPAAEGAVYSARLGVLLVERFRDFAHAVDPLERARAAGESLPPDQRSAVVESLASCYRALLAEPAADTAEPARKLAAVLAQLAPQRAGAERAALRAELGDVHRVHLHESKEAIAAYEAALANDAAQEQALLGLRALVDDTQVERAERLLACRALLPRYEALSNDGARAHVLTVQLSLETAPNLRRALSSQLAAVLANDLDTPDDAFDVLLAQVRADPADDGALAQLEALAGPLDRVTALAAAYVEIRDAARTAGNGGTSLAFAHRLATLLTTHGDLPGAIEALQVAAEMAPAERGPWFALLALHERRNDAAAMAEAYERLVALSDGAEQRERLLDLAEFYFENVLDDMQGLATLRRAHALMPQDDNILARLEGRLRLLHADTPELAELVGKRAALQEQPAARASLLLEHGNLLLRMGDVSAATASLRESLRIERDGNSTPKTTDALKRIAAGGDQAGRDALDVLIEHHRAQKAWQPLVESLEIAAHKRPAGQERAALFDEISTLNEQAIRVMPLAFMATCRALRDAPTVARLRRAKELAPLVESLPELLEVLEDTAGVLGAHPEEALLYLREAQQVAVALHDMPSQVRLAEAILVIAKDDKAALQALEAIHRTEQDQQALVDVLRRRAMNEADPSARSKTLVEMARLLISVDDAAAEQALRDARAANPDDVESLDLLDALYERTGNSAALVEVLNERIARAQDPQVVAGERARLALLLVSRRGDPAGALEQARLAVAAAPAHASLRAMLEVLIEQGKSRGAPPLGDSAALLQAVLAAQGDQAGVPAAIELRLTAETEPAGRAALMREAATVQEQLGQPALAFMMICRAVKEQPEDAELRDAAERLAVATDNLEGLGLVYEDVLEAVTDPATKISLHKRMAEIAEQQSQDVDAARTHLRAAVGAGAKDTETLKNVVRLARIADDAEGMSEALARLGRAAIDEEKVELAKESFAELCDVDENLGDIDGAIRSARELLGLDENDAGARATLERLLNRAEHWTELSELLTWMVRASVGPEQRALVLARLIYVELERLKNFKGGVDALLHLAEVSPASEAIAALCTRALLLLSGDARPEAAVLRAQVAELLDPRLEANGQWGELAPVLRLRLDAERRPAERKRLWMRVIDIEERMLSRPEQAMVSLARALAEDPGDVGLRERAERLAVRLRDLEGLLGIYEDIIESAQKSDPHRITYALRCGELYEGSVGQPLRAAEFYDIALEAAEVQGMAQPDRMRILERVERLHRAVGEPQLLAKTLRRKAALSAGDDHKSARDALFEAAKLQVHGLQDFGAAMETLNKLLEKNPSDVAALRALAEAAEKQERWSEAAEALERELVAIGTSDVPRSHQARFMLGVILDNRLGLSDAALVHFQAILEEDPNHPQTRAYLESRLTQRQTGKYDGAVFLTASYERTGDWQKAVEVLQAQLPDLERRGDRKEIQTQLFKIAKIQEEQLNAPDLAFITLCRALKNEPSDPNLRVRLKALAQLNETVDDLIEVYDDEALAADVSGRSSLAAELREGSAELVASVIGDKPRAILLYEAILEKQAGRLAPLEALSALYAEAGRFADLEKVLRRRLMFKDDPVDRVPILVELAGALIDHLDRPEEALPLLEEARRLDANASGARRLLIELFDTQGELVQLRALLDEEIRACEAAQDEQGRARARRRLAVLLSDQLDDVTGAIPLWEEQRAWEVKEAGRPAAAGMAFNTLERLYGKSQRHAELKALYEAALKGERDPQVVGALTVKLGDVLAHLGGTEEAVQRHLKVLEVDPQNAGSLNALRGFYWDLGRYDELAALLRKLMRATSQSTQLKDLRFQLAEVLGGKLNKRAEAVETGRRILDIEPHTAPELVRLAAIFRTLEAWEELADVLERAAAQLQGSERVQRLLELATLFEDNLRRPEQALPAYERILAAEPSNERAFDRLAKLYESHADWQKLVNLKDQRAKLHPDARRRVELLKDVGALYEDKLDQPAMAFLAACRAFREDLADDALASWMDRLAVETDSVEELVTIYDDALGHLADESRIIDTHVRMAELLWKNLQNHADAELHFKRALEFKSGESRALDGLVALYEEQRRWRDAVGVLERQIEGMSASAARTELLRRVAVTLDSKAMDIDGAVDAYRRILEDAPADAAASASLGEIFERVERWPELVALLERNERQAPATDARHAIRMRIAAVQEEHLDSIDDAVASYRQILEENPAHLPALRALERLFTAQQRHKELVQVFEQMAAVADDDARVGLLFKIGAVWEESLDDLGKAVDANERILAIDADNERAVENLERLFRAREEWPKLIAAYERHITLTRDPGEIVHLHVLVGEVYGAQLDRTDKAEQMYQAALDFDPASQEAIHALGALYEKSGNWFNALEKLQAEAQLLGASDAAVEIYHRIGNINAQMLMETDNAVHAYKAALEIEPAYLPSIRALKAIAFGNGETAANKTDYLHWLRQEAQHAREEAERTALHTTTGLFLQDTLADLEGASDEFEKALAITFDHLAAARPLADICFREENWTRAEQLLDIIVEQLDATENATDLCRQHYRLGYVCEKLGKDSKALKNYQRAYELDSTYLPVLEGLGAALSKADRWDDAAKIYQAILIHHRDGLTDAEIVDYYAQLAELSHKLGQNDRAIKSLEKALELDANHAPSLRLLATVYGNEGRHEDCYEVLIRLAPLLTGEERTRVLIEIGSLAKGPLDDPYRAIDAFEDANRQRPGDKAILEAMLALYRQARQGPRAVEVLEELVRIEQDERTRVRLNQTLGEVYRDELKLEPRAVQYFNAALDLDPTFVKAFEALEGMLSGSQNWGALEENYIAMLKRIPETRAGIKEVLWKNLGDLYRYRLKNLEGATQAYRVLVKMQPENVEYLEVLAELLARNPASLEDSAAVHQRVIQLNPDKIARSLHELVRLSLGLKAFDRAYVFSQTLKVLNDIKGNEAEILQIYGKQVPPQAKRRMTDKLWDVLLVHPAARGPIASISAILWRTAGSAIALQPRDYGLDKKKSWERKDLDAPVVPYFINQLKFVRGVLATGAFEFYEKVDGAEPLAPLCLEQPTLALGRGSPMLRETQGKLLWFLIAKQLTALRPAFMLPRTLGAEKFNALLDIAIKLVEPRYPARVDPKLQEVYERALAKLAQPLANALRPHVAELLKARQAVSTKSFFEGLEHTAIRAGYILTGDLELSMQLLRHPDTGAIPVAHGAKVRELLLFAVSEEHFELRTRLGTGIEP